MKNKLMLTVLIGTISVALSSCGLFGGGASRSKTTLSSLSADYTDCLAKIKAEVLEKMDEDPDKYNNPTGSQLDKKIEAELSRLVSGKKTDELKLQTCSNKGDSVKDNVCKAYEKSSNNSDGDVENDMGSGEEEIDTEDSVTAAQQCKALFRSIFVNESDADAFINDSAIDSFISTNLPVMKTAWDFKDTSDAIICADVLSLSYFSEIAAKIKPVSVSYLSTILALLATDTNKVPESLLNIAKHSKCKTVRNDIIANANTTLAVQIQNKGLAYYLVKLIISSRVHYCNYGTHADPCNKSCLYAYNIETNKSSSLDSCFKTPIQNPTPAELINQYVSDICGTNFAISIGSREYLNKGLEAFSSAVLKNAGKLKAQTTATQQEVPSVPNPTCFSCGGFRDLMERNIVIQPEVLNSNILQQFNNINVIH